MAVIEPIAREQLGQAIERLEIRIGPRALAEASVAVVLPGSWRSPGGSRTEGVLKVLKPSVAERLGEELAVLARLGDYLDERREAYGLPAIAHRATFDTVGDLLRHEVRLGLEQRHLVGARQRYASFPAVQVPALLPFSTPSLTAMERVHGVTVTDTRIGSDAERRRLDPRSRAEIVVRSLLAAPVFDHRDDAVFHADPHAGNLFATDDGRLAVLDWSLVGHLGKQDRVAITRIVLGALCQDQGDLAEALGELAGNSPSRELLADPIANALHEVRCGRLPGPGWLVDFLDGVVAAGVSFPASLLLFRKTLFTLRGVVADIDPSCSIDAVFLAAAMRRLVEEWPSRLAASPLSRSFATHVSMLDLARVCTWAPATVMGWWSQAALGRSRRLAG
jgi:ubiquinone biosynthesis protein